MWQIRRGLIPQTAALAGGAGGGGGGDPQFSSVVLLMGFEGTNGATGAPGMTDEGSAAHGTATVNGANAKISTAQFKFGASSLTTGTSSQITFPDSSDWAFGAGSFTVEMFIYPNSLSGLQFLCGQWGSAGQFGWVLYANGTALTWNSSTSGGDNNTDASGGTLATGSWQHVCVDYDGSKYRLYIAGTMVASFSTPRTLVDSSQVLAISGNASNSAFQFNGFIDELRITKGVARYATDTSFTVPTAAFPRS